MAWNSKEIEQKLQCKKHKGTGTKMPAEDIFLDEGGHWPEFMDKCQRCKNPNCKGL